MQREFALRAGLLFCTAGLAGCPATPPANPLGKPYAGQTLAVSAPPAMAAALAGPGKAWANRSGAVLALAAAAPEPDIVVVPVADVGAWADRAAAVPVELQGEDQPAKWTRILPAYRDRLTGWGAANIAVPLAGEGYAVVYRADLWADPAHAAGFLKKFGRGLVPPASWEDVAEAAEYFAAATGKPSLPPLPPGNAVLRDFHFLAACYDRPVLAESSLTKSDRVDLTALPRILSFHHTLPAGTPRLTAPGFTAAAAWLHRTAKLRPPGESADQAASLLTGTAVIAVLDFAEVAKLAGGADEVPAKFGVAPLPGTRTTADPVSGKAIPAVGPANFVPYFGSTGYAAVVLKGGPRQAAAFDFLADACSPARSLDTLAATASGFGPYRTEHLEQAREGIFQGFRFDPPRTKILADACRKFATPATANPCYPPRGPDAAELLTLLEGQVRKAAKGEVEPAAAMAAAQAAWQAHDAKTPQAGEWRRKAAGLN